MFQAISYGTIPYLGTFLTDLTMIDTAICDTVTDGLINFDKRRKEFEVLAQVTIPILNRFIVTCPSTQGHSSTSKHKDSVI